MEDIQSFLFISHFLAHAADGRLDDTERDRIAAVVADVGVQLGHGPEVLGLLQRASEDEYWLQLNDGPETVLRTYQEAVQNLHIRHRGAPAIVDGLQRALLEIAGADGRIDDMEATLIEGMVKKWRERLMTPQ